MVNNLQHVPDYGKDSDGGPREEVSASDQPAAPSPRPSGARSGLGTPTVSGGVREPGADSTQTRVGVSLLLTREEWLLAVDPVALMRAKMENATFGMVEAAEAAWGPAGSAL